MYVASCTILSKPPDACGCTMLTCPRLWKEIAHSLAPPICRQPRAVVVRRACAAHAAAGCVAAALLACACNLAPPLYRRTGSGVGLLEGALLTLQYPPF